LILELDGAIELAFALALEEEELAGPRAGNEIELSVAVEIHQLWSEADASARRHFAVEFDALRELGRVLRPVIAIDPQDAVAELADEQVAFAVTEEIADKRRGMADVGVDELAAGLQADRRGEVGG